MIVNPYVGVLTNIVISRKHSEKRIKRQPIENQR